MNACSKDHDFMEATVIHLGLLRRQAVVQWICRRCGHIRWLRWGMAGDVLEETTVTTTTRKES